MAFYDISNRVNESSIKLPSLAQNHLRKIEMAREETARTKTNGASERGGFVIRKWNRQCMGAVAVDCGGADIFRANASRAR